MVEKLDQLFFNFINENVDLQAEDLEFHGMKKTPKRLLMSN
jgi:hypothetical protein